MHIKAAVEGIAIKERIGTDILNLRIPECPIETRQNLERR